MDSVVLYVQALANLATQLPAEETAEFIKRLGNILRLNNEGQTTNETLMNFCEEIQQQIQTAIRQDQENSRFSKNPLTADQWPLPPAGYETRGGDAFDMFRSR